MIKLRRFVSGFGLAAAALCGAGLWASGCVSTGSSGGGDAGASPDGGNGNTTNTHTNMQIPAAISIKGLIKNDQDVPVANAEITVGSVMSASSDTDGVFDVDTAPTSDSVVLKISAPDHAPQVVKVPLKARVANYAVPVVMKRVQSLPIPMGTTDTQIQIGSSPAAVSFDGPMGSAATLRFVSMDASEGPGDLRFVDSADTQGVQSSGMLWVELTDETGNTIPMPGGKVTMSVDNTEVIQGAQAWQSMSMDPNQAEWTGEGGSSADAGAVLPTLGQQTFDLNRLGYWGVGRAYPTACIRGVLKAESDAGLGCLGSRVQATGPGGVFSFDSVGDDGSFCLAGPEAAQMTVAVGINQVFETMPSRPGSCRNLKTCQDIGQILIPAGGCDLMAGMPTQPALFDTGHACTAKEQCTPGNGCYNGFCAGTGLMRVSLSFNVASDYDLHLKTPNGNEIYYSSPTADGGTLDVDQCVGSSCDSSTHFENIVFTTDPPPGIYEVWVVNYGGSAGGPFAISVSGAARAHFSGTLPAVSQTPSQHFLFTPGQMGDAGAPDQPPVMSADAG